jgi:iron complex transport system substrate-binding protein
MNKRIIACLIIISCFTIAGWIPVKGNSGTSISPPKSRIPRRIISLIPSVTEELYLLKVENNLVGCTTYCVRPEEAAEKERVGNNLVINIEKIVQLKPDLVFVAEYTDLKILKRLEQFSIPIKKYPTPGSFKEICSAFLDLGKVVGRAELARSLIGKIKAKVEKIRRRVRGKPGVRVFFQLGSNPLFAATKISFTNDYIEFAGGINVVRNAGEGIISREEVLKRNPQVILIVDMGVKARTARKGWEKFGSLSAVQHNRIYIVDASKYCLPSPQSFIETLEEVSFLLHPVKKKQ